MDITNLVRRLNKQQPIVTEEEEIPASIDGFDVAERISYIGMLRREIDALDFSLPILKSLFKDKPEPKKKENLTGRNTGDNISGYFYNPYIPLSGTSNSLYRDGIWSHDKVELSKTVAEKSKILAGNILKERNKTDLVPHDNEIDYIVDIVGLTVESISNFAGVQVMQAPVTLVYNLGVVGVSEENIINNVQITSIAVEASSRKLSNSHIESGLPERFTKGLSEVEEYLIDVIRTKTETVKLESESNLLSEIQRLSYLLSKRNKRGAANRLMVSSKFGSVLDYILSLSQNKYQTQSETHKIDKDIRISRYSKYIGMLFGAVKVYASPYLKEDEMFLYYQGDNDTDVGFTYCPFVIYNESGRIVNPVTFEPVIMAMSRSGMITDKIPDYYTRIEYNGKVE